MNEKGIMGKNGQDWEEERKHCACAGDKERRGEWRKKGNMEGRKEGRGLYDEMALKREEGKEESFVKSDYKSENIFLTQQKRKICRLYFTKKY